MIYELIIGGGIGMVDTIDESMAIVASGNYCAGKRSFGAFGCIIFDRLPPLVLLGGWRLRKRRQQGRLPLSPKGTNSVIYNR